MQKISDYANERKLRIEGGNFPKRGRMVGNLKINVTSESFFVINNFVDPEVFDLIAYSHEDDAAWKNIWIDLISKISKEFEASTVERK